MSSARPSARFNRKRFRGASSSIAIVSGLGVSFATFSFQAVQVWVDEGSHDKAVRWAIPSLVSTVILLFTATLFLVYWLLRTTSHQISVDPYKAFAEGVVAYGQVLHHEKRDPALLRLRDNTSLTLHVLGFHEERVTLGAWALESAQFVDDKLGIISILIDDLGWTKYLLDSRDAVVNIEKGIRFGEQLDAKTHGPRLDLLLAKAYRHLGVIKTSKQGSLQNIEFERAKEILAGIADILPDGAKSDAAHVEYAKSLAITSMLGVNVSGNVRKTDRAATSSLRKALECVRKAREGFHASDDQGRHAKSLVLEVRILEALHEVDEAKHLAPLRDRMVAASVWARPAGAAYITGR